MALLVGCVEKPDVNAALLTRVYKCLGSWVNLGAVNSQELATSVLLFKAFQSLAAPDTPSSLHEAITGRPPRVACLAFSFLLSRGTTVSQIADLFRHSHI